MAVSVAAQETTPPETTTPETTVPETPPAAVPEAAQAPEAAVPAQPEVEVTEHGDWEVGCMPGTPNCEMQQVAMDDQGNPVILVRVVRLPSDAEALALAVFNTPLGTLLPPGIGFQIDQGEQVSLPFEWCVQEGCVVRLGLREEDVTALKRGGGVRLQVASIAAPTSPVNLTLSLSGFTAAYDMLPVPETPVQPATPAPATE